MDSPKPTRRLIFGTIGAAIALSMAFAAGANAATVLAGQITDRATAKPVSQATISLFAAGASSRLVETQSIVNGSYILHVGRPGDYRVKVDAEGYVSCWRTISSSRQREVTLNVSLPPQPLLHLRLLLPDGKPLGPHALHPAPGNQFAPQVDISVLVSPRGRGPSIYQKFSASVPPPDVVLPAQWHVVRHGKMDVALSQPLPHGSMMVGVVARMEGIGAAQVILDHWPNGPVMLHLQPDCAIRVRVHGAGDTPVKGANASVTGIDEDLGLRALQPSGYTQTVGPDGWLSLTNLPPGRYIVTYHDTSRGFLYRVVEAQAPTTAVVLQDSDSKFEGLSTAWGADVKPWSQAWRTEVRVRPGPLTPVQMNGTVVDAVSGLPVRDASVADYVPGDPTIPLDIERCANDGSFRLAAPGEGTYRIREFDHTHLFSETTMTAGTGPVAIRAVTRPVLHVTVVDENGRTLGKDAARVEVYSIGANASEVVDSGTDSAPGPPISLLAPREAPRADLKRLVIRATSATGIAQVSLPHRPDGPVRVQFHPGLALSCELDGDPGERYVVVYSVDGPGPRLFVVAKETGPSRFLAGPPSVPT